MPLEERLLSVSLALEDALVREDWDEADALFASREAIYQAIPPLAVPPEVDDIDARILNRLSEGLAEIRRETALLTQSRRAAAAYGGNGHPMAYRAA